MSSFTELREYLVNENNWQRQKDFAFKISFQEDLTENTFVINLKIKQNDSKEEKLIKFRFGIGQDKVKEGAVHQTQIPHFEIDYYNRQTYSATIYFTFLQIDEESILSYAKGTIQLIVDVLKTFCQNHKLDNSIIQELLYEDAIIEELAGTKDILIDALYQSYSHNELIVREDGKSVIVKTPHNLQKYLDSDELQALYLPLRKRL